MIPNGMRVIGIENAKIEVVDGLTLVKGGTVTLDGTPEDYQVGGLVRLRSGGPKMTITAIFEKETATCTWFPTTDGSAPLEVSFPLSVLDPIKVIT